MVPICMARGPADRRRQELRAGPGALQRFFLRVAGWGQRPAVVRQPAAVAPRAYGPLAI
jgi:hypothetical protein